MGVDVWEWVYGSGCMGMDEPGYGSGCRLCGCVIVVRDIHSCTDSGHSW